MNISAHSAVEIGHRVKFTTRAMDGLGGTSDSYRATLSGKRGTVTDLPERHMALVLWDGHEKPERVVRHYLEPEFTTTPAPDVQAQERDPLIFLDTMSHDLAMAAAEEEDVQAQIDAAYERGVADGLRKARS